MALSPHPVSQTVSIYKPFSPIQVRDETVARLRQIAGIKKVYKAHTIPTQDTELPCISVFHLGERAVPSGDANCGEPKFDHRLKLCIDIINLQGEEEVLDNTTTAFVEAVKLVLFRDATWISLMDGFEGYELRYNYPTQADGYYVQAQFEIDIFFRSEWPPLAPHELCTVGFSYEHGKAEDYTPNLYTEVDLH